MEPAKARPPATLSQRVQDIAERLSTLAKAEIYQVLEGIAPSGDFSSLYRLDPLINDIVLQLSDNFKQAVTKRLLPEASKLLGSRSAANATSAPCAGGQPPQPQSPNALTANVKQHSPLENDILALGLAPGTGQPLRPDQGPPQDAASAAASTLLQGAAVTASSPALETPSLSPPPSVTDIGASGGTSTALHPPESRFTFANATGDSRRTPLPSPLSRDGGYGGAAAADLVPAADPLLFLGLGDSGTGLGFGGGGGGDTAANGLAMGVDHFLLGSSLAGSIGSGGGGRATPGVGFSPVTSPSPHTVNRHLGSLSLAGTPGGSSGGGSAAAAVRNASSTASSPSPNLSTPSPYPALPLAIRPGSSLDPGLATPPVSLAGTEPLRGTSNTLQFHHHYQSALTQHPHPHLGRLSIPGDASSLGGGSIAAPPPLFGGAPGPSPTGASISSHEQQFLKQQRQQQQTPPHQHQHHYMMGGGGVLGAVGEGGMLSGLGGGGGSAAGAGAGLLSNANGNAALYQMQQQQQLQTQYLQQQQQLQQHNNTNNQVTADYQRQQYSLVQQQQLSQQRHVNTGQYDSSGIVPVSAVRTALAAASEGPRAPYDNRTTINSYTVQSALEVPYEAQLLYGGANGPNAMDLHPTGAFGDRYPPPGPGAIGGRTAAAVSAASPEYGMYGLAPLAAGGGSAIGTGGGMMVDMMRAASSGNGGGAATFGMLQQANAAAGPTVAGFGGGGAAVVPGGVGRGGGSPAMVLTVTGAPGAAASRPSRSGTASAASIVDSRSSSFSAGPIGPQTAPRRGSGNGGTGTAAAQSPFTPQRPSPPASDASGPSSVASVSTAGGAAVLAAAAVGGGGGAAGTAKSGGGAVAAGDSASPLSMAAKLQQVHLEAEDLVASKPAPSPGAVARSKGGSGGGGGGPKAPADMPGRFRCLPPAVQARIHALTRDNHVVLLKDFDEKVLSKMTLLVDKFGAAECLAMLDRIEEVLKGKAGRLANGPGYLDVSVSTRLDELKQRASGQVTAPEDYARSTLHSRIYAELRDLISRHGFLQWHHFDQGIINMLKKMPNATALERLNELAYHSFKNVDNPKSCIVSIFTTKPKYITTA